MPSRGSRRRELERVIEVFARGFAFTRSFTHPYVPERVGPAWVMRDAPRRDPRRYRREEWTANGVEPDVLDKLARDRTRGRFALCPIRAMDEPDRPTREAYRALGYRLGTTEAMMIHRLVRIPRVPPPGVAIERVTTRAGADRLAEAAGRRQLLPEHLVPDPPVRQYVAVDGDDPVGWVQSIVVACGSGSDTEVMTSCSNMYVRPAYRRRGIARALLARMLRDDRRNGATASSLLASHAGAKLYPAVGYEQIGELLAYTPKNR